MIKNAERNGFEIAVIGMAGRFPKSKNLEEFWFNLKNGFECISRFSREELAAAGVSQELLNAPSYVKAKGILQDIDLFDADFFNYSRRDALFMDPQTRIFHEIVYEALEDAGYDSNAYDGAIGLYTGAASNVYWENLSYQASSDTPAGKYAAWILNDKDFLATRVSQKMNLTGTSLIVQTACSSSLVAIDTACRNLLTGGCSMAIAGGIAVDLPQKQGYLHEKDMIFSPDGHCRAFDSKAKGTVRGEGGGVVVLKRLQDALDDKDNIHAVILGTGTNNDGTRKIGYTAPSEAGQIEAIRAAHYMGDVEPETITYVEAHGTGTSLGDPIEVEALTRAFDTPKRGYCRIGSVKTNIGHLDVAAGTGAVIKTILSLKNKQIPPSLNFESPNPEINFETSPFKVNDTLHDWERLDDNDGDQIPLRAGISSFGIGGTNAHVVLEEAPCQPPREENGLPSMLMMSARSQTALDTMTANLGTFLKKNPETNLKDAAYTLQVGRALYPYRRVVMASNASDASDALIALKKKQSVTCHTETDTQKIAFMFPGQGSQYINMGLTLYDDVPFFKAEMDKCFSIFQSETGFDIKTLLYPDTVTKEGAEQINQTGFTQPLLFMIEYSLARLLMSYGVQPDVMIGHSIGEYVAACIAGVFRLEDGLSLVIKRGKLIQALPSGSMLSVAKPEKGVLPLLNEKLSIGVINSPSHCVVSGEDDDIADFKALLSQKGVASTILHTSHAFHSFMMEPVLEEFTQAVNAVERHTPAIPFVSNVTGKWITEDQAMSPEYWAKHMRNAVRFADGVQTLQEIDRLCMIEVGPGKTLTTLTKRFPGMNADHIINLLRHPRESRPDTETFFLGLGKLWCNGGLKDWDAFYKEKRNRISLPTYPFERKSYWLEDKALQAQASAPAGKMDIEDWFYASEWASEERQPLADDTPGNWLILSGSSGISLEINTYLEDRGHRTELIHPEQSTKEEYDIILGYLEAENRFPDKILHCLSIDDSHQSDVSGERNTHIQEQGFFSLMALTQALSKYTDREIKIGVVSNKLQKVTDTDIFVPEKASLLGLCKVIPQEYKNIDCISLDILLQEADAGLYKDIVLEVCGNSESRVVALRDKQRWVRKHKRLELNAPEGIPDRLRKNGVYLITGGTGGIGLTLGSFMANAAGANLILTAMPPLPPRQEWAACLETENRNSACHKAISAIRTLEETGSRVHIINGDIADYDLMKEELSAAEKAMGTVNGVLHCAGVAGAGIITLKRREDAQKVFQPKIDGAVVLYQLFKDHHLDFFVNCSSITSTLGGLGQSDYTAANSVLDQFSSFYTEQTGNFSAAIGWYAWEKVGMAVQARYETGEVIEEDIPLDHPLLTRRLKKGSGYALYESRISFDDAWPLYEHKMDGRGIMVGTSLIEMVRAAFEDFSGTDIIEIRDVVFLIPIMANPDETKQAKIVFKAEDDGYSFSVASKIFDEGDNSGKWVQNVTGNICVSDKASFATVDVEEIKASCNKDRFCIRLEDAPAADMTIDKVFGAYFQDLGSHLKEETAGNMTFDEIFGSYFLDLGSHWDVVREINKGDGGMLAVLKVPSQYAGESRVWKFHPSVLDMATSVPAIEDVATGNYLAEESSYLPFSYKSIKINGGVSETVYSYIRLSDDDNTSKEFTKYDLLVINDTGEVCIEIRDFIRRKVGAAQAVGEISPQYIFDEDDIFQAPDDGKGPGIVLDDGILPEEGIEVFKRVLASDYSQVIVSPHKMEDAEKQVVTIDTMEKDTGAQDLEQAGQTNAAATATAASVSTGNALDMLTNLFQDFLKTDEIDIKENFFDLGASSLDLIQISGKLEKMTGKPVSIDLLFEYSTIHDLAGYLSDGDEDPADEAPVVVQTDGQNKDIAVIGMAGRFPGAENVDAFWHNLKSGRESVNFFTDEELLEAGVPQELLDHPSYVRAKGYIDDVEGFDAGFFGYNPKKAALLSPQSRQLHACAYRSLEEAGYNSLEYDGRISFFAGGASNYHWQTLTFDASPEGEREWFSRWILNDKDFMVSRIAYDLNLKGPNYVLQTACSTSLVAIHLACRSLIEGSSEMALAGGVSVQLPKKTGYIYQEGLIYSPDGHCRAFDAESNGTVFGSGVGVVVLKPLDKALADGDHIHAVIKGSAINNDGNRKVSYTAPSVKGQKEVIQSAIRVADVDPETIGYVETHGTGTAIGDTTEISSLTEAFNTDKKGFCRIGSVKTNVGHLDAAAGVTSFIKTVLSLKNKQIPPNVHYKTPNPKIPFEKTPFVVNAELTDWTSENGEPIRAGVSSFGVGGTNAHIVLEEAPAADAQKRASRKWNIVALSGRTEKALDEMTGRMADFFSADPSADFADSAYTLIVGRKALKHRKIVVSTDETGFADAVERNALPAVFTNRVAGRKKAVFLFGDQMDSPLQAIRSLYENEEAFKREADACFTQVKDHTGIDLAEALYFAEAVSGRAASLAPALLTCCLELSVARVMANWGGTPSCVIGSGIGEFTAACFSGAISFESLIEIVTFHVQKDEEGIAPQFDFNIPSVPFVSASMGIKITGETRDGLSSWIKGVTVGGGRLEAIRSLQYKKDPVFLKMGYGESSVSLPEDDLIVFNTIEKTDDDGDRSGFNLFRNIGVLWCYGFDIHWSDVYAHENRVRVSLPGYPLQNTRCWPDTRKKDAVLTA
ncbi:MAG: SDR family NAD(P)-dependent oxidoreductase [Desulfobacter sp.]